MPVAANTQVTAGRQRPVCQDRRCKSEAVEVITYTAFTIFGTKAAQLWFCADHGPSRAAIERMARLFGLAVEVEAAV